MFRTMKIFHVQVRAPLLTSNIIYGFCIFLMIGVADDILTRIDGLSLLGELLSDTKNIIDFRGYAHLKHTTEIYIYIYIQSIICLRLEIIYCVSNFFQREAREWYNDRYATTKFNQALKGLPWY